MKKSSRKNTAFSGAELVGVSSTYYTDKNDPRFELALENAERWRDKGLPYVVVDGSPQAESGQWVSKAHAERGAHVERAHISGIATQRLQGVAFAVTNGAEKIVGHEPEKVNISDFSMEISQGLDQHAVLVIGRTEAARNTLPTVQHRTEKLAGWILEETHHLPPDTLSGGRGFNIEGAAVLGKYPAAQQGFNNWIYLYDTPLLARSENLSVDGIEIELLHPVSMKQQEDGNPVFDRKRYDQFKLQLDYLLARPDIDISARSSVIARATLRALSTLDELSENSDFEEQLNKLESRFRSYGYSR